VATTPGRIRPWRYLTAFVGIVAALYALVFFTGDGRAVPKLGIDLQGGTRVTLQARTESGAEAPREQLLQAQSIIQERVDGLGVSGAEVVLDGSNLTITVPGQEGEQARSLGQTAQLRFREVVGGPVAAGAAAPAPGATDPAAPPAGTDPAAPSGQAPAPSAEPSVAPAPAGQPPADQPQGAGDPAAPVVEAPVAPVALSTPLTGADPAGQPTPEPTPPAPTPTPTPGAGTPPPASTPAGPADPELAAAIAAARETRQSTDPAVQSLALQQLDCQVQDPLRGYDDPALPLVACNQDGTEKYVLGRVFLEGTQVDTAQAQQNSQGVGWVISLTFKSEGAAIWGEYTTQNVGKNAAFVLDGEVVSAPTINGPIFGTTEISGRFNQESAQRSRWCRRSGR